MRVDAPGKTECQKPSNADVFLAVAASPIIDKSDGCSGDEIEPIAIALRRCNSGNRPRNVVQEIIPAEHLAPQSRWALARRIYTTCRPEPLHGAESVPHDAAMPDHNRPAIGQLILPVRERCIAERGAHVSGPVHPLHDLHTGG